MSPPPPGWIKLGAVDSLVAADFDQDGDTDLVTSAPGGLKFLRNDGGNANKQLKLRLLGNRSNASGLGVRVELCLRQLANHPHPHPAPV